MKVVNMRSRTTPLIGVLGGLLLAIVAVASVAAYAGEVAATVRVNGPSSQVCDTPITISATVEDLAGDPIEGQPVTWSFVSGNVAGDVILDTTTTTNANGVATTQVRVSTTPHTVTILAQADDASGTIVIDLRCAGLPGTNTAPESSAMAMILAAFAVLLGAGAILRRFATAAR